MTKPRTHPRGTTTPSGKIGECSAPAKKHVRITQRSAALPYDSAALRDGRAALRHAVMARMDAPAALPHGFAAPP